MLKGRLGLDSAKIPHADRAGLLSLARGGLTARDGTLAFEQARRTEADARDPGNYAIPLQGISMILLGPGSTVSHDALRLLAHARTARAAVGEDGVRLYTAPPVIPDRSGLARLQARSLRRRLRRPRPDRRRSRPAVVGALGLVVDPRERRHRDGSARQAGDRPPPHPNPGRATERNRRRRRYLARRTRAAIVSNTPLFENRTKSAPSQGEAPPHPQG